MEECPSGNYYEMVVDLENEAHHKELYRFLTLLSKLKVIDYGTIYEQIDSVRIKAR